MISPIRFSRHFLALTLYCGLASGAAAAEATSYTLSKQYGSVLFRTLFQDTLYMVGRFDDYAGSLSLDPADLSTASLEASVNMGSLSMADGDVAETLVNSSMWFNAPLFPRATFTSTSVSVTGDNTLEFNGDLDFMGVTRPWTLHATFFGGSDGVLSGSTIGMHATGSFLRSEFGLDQYMNMAADEVSIEVNVKFNRN